MPNNQEFHINKTRILYFFLSDVWLAIFIPLLWMEDWLRHEQLYLIFIAIFNALIFSYSAVKRGRVLFQREPALMVTPDSLVWKLGKEEVDIEWDDIDSVDREKNTFYVFGFDEEDEEFASILFYTQHLKASDCDVLEKIFTSHDIEVNKK